MSANAQMDNLATERGSLWSEAWQVLRRRKLTMVCLWIVVGYTLMRVENEVDGFLSLVVAPLLILGGYIEVIFAILWRPKETEAEAS